MSDEFESIGADVFRERAETRIAELRSLLGAVTLAAEDRQRLLELSDEVGALAGEIREVAERDVTPEEFGSAESYWIVFRMFCVAPNVGRTLTLEEVWSRVSHYCDMSEEDLTSLRVTLFDWADDMALDAHDKYGLRGKLIELPGGLCFAPYETISKDEPIAPKETPRAVSAKKSELKEKPPTAEEVPAACKELVIALLLEQSPQKQSVVRAQLSDVHGVSQKQSLDLITSMVEDGKIVKAKPVGSQSALLALDTEGLKTSKSTKESSPETETSSERQQVDVQLGSQILSVLANERQHLRKMEPSEIWQRIHTAAHRKPDRQALASIRKTARQLAHYGLLEVGEAKKGTKAGEFGVKRLSQRGNKSKSMSVFKTGLATFELKTEIKSIMESRSGDLEKWLAEKLEDQLAD